MGLNIPKVPEVPKFLSSVGDGDNAIYDGGEIVPDEKEKILIFEDFNNTSSFSPTIVTSGSFSVSNSILTVNTGTTNNGGVVLNGNIKIGKGKDMFPFYIEFRARGNYSAVLKQEWGVGILASTGFIKLGYNLNEDDNVLILDSWYGAQGSGTSSTYTENQWIIYKVKVLDIGTLIAFEDDVKVSEIKQYSPQAVPSEEDYRLLISNYTRQASGANQTLEIDWIKVYKE